MKKVLWILNKYSSPKIDAVFYPHFMKYTQEYLLDNNIQISFAHFSSNFKEHVLAERNYFFDDCSVKISSTNIMNEANRIENEYKFTFNQSFFADKLQSSKHTGYHFHRIINLLESEFYNKHELVIKFIYLENLIKKDNYNLVFCEQSSDYEMEFGRAICNKLNTPFIRQVRSFMGLNIFLRQYGFAQESIIDVANKENYTINDAKKYIDNFLKYKLPPYNYKAPYIADKRSFIFRIFENDNNLSLIKFVLSNIIKIGKRFRNLFYKLLFLIEQHIIKPYNQDLYDPTLPYLYFGFHMPTESTVSLRSLPFTNQMALVQQVSRVLPYGYYLYIREHPHWPNRFPADSLKLANKYPHVRLISPKISNHDLIHNSKGIVTLNGTMGIEALMYNRPVLALAPNIYYKHPAVIQCFNLYELGSKLVELTNIQININDTYKYIRDMFNISTDVDLDSLFFYSDDDAKQKAKSFTTHFIKVFESSCNNKS